MGKELLVSEPIGVEDGGEEAGESKGGRRVLVSVTGDYGGLRGQGGGGGLQ